MPGAPLELHELEESFRALVEDPQANWAAIGRRVGRHPTTMAREINAGDGRERYEPPATALGGTGAAAVSDQRGVAPGRSPAAIRADLVAEGVPQAPCVETAYQALYVGALDVKPSECLRSRRRRRCRQGRNPGRRPVGRTAPIVPPPSTSARWRATGVDQIIDAYNRSSMTWLTERQSRYLIPVTMPDGYDADAVFAGLIEGLDTVPAHLDRSLTFDCGSEWANWRASPTTTTCRCGPATRARRGNAARSRTRTAKSAGGSHGASTCAPSPPPEPNTPLTSSTTNAAAASTTKAPPNSVLTSPCSDHQNWPTAATNSWPCPGASSTTPDAPSCA